MLLKGFSQNFKRKKGERLSGWKVWTRRFAELYNKDRSLNGVYRDKNFYSDGFSTYSQKDKITNYYTLDKLPSELPISYVDKFRSHEVISGDTKIQFVSILVPTNIDWHSPAMKNKLRVWESNSLETEQKRVTGYNFRLNLNSLISNKLRQESLIYLANAEARGRTLFKYMGMMIISGVRGDDFDSTTKNAEKLAKRLDIKATRVTESLHTYLRSYSPFAYDKDSKLNKQVGNITLTDEHIARFKSFDQGKIGVRGIYWGTDIYSGYPVLKVVKKTTETAENWLITGSTGSGKSVGAKVIITQLSADKNYTGTIMDIEGFEYLPLAELIGKSEKVVVLNMAQGQGQYYDPVEINLTGIQKLDEEMMSISMSFTRSIFKALIGEVNTGEQKRVDSIISKAVSETYRKVGVTENPRTWKNSKGLTLRHVYESFLEIYQDTLLYRYKQLQSQDVPNIKDNYKLNDNYMDTLDNIASSLQTYFESFENGGVNSGFFKNRITLSEIVDAKLVICSFGLAGKTEDQIDPIQLDLSQSYAAIISYIRSMFSKARGKYNFKVWEEFQRWGRIRGSESIVNSALTGGRKNGDVNIIITNKISEMLGDNDKFNIFENTDSFMIGVIGDANVRTQLCQQLSIPELEQDLHTISEERKRNKEGLSTTGSIYENAFLIKLDRADVGIVRMEIPEELLQSDIFRTGITLQ